MGEKDAPKPESEMSVSEKIARQADLNRLAREARGDFGEPRRSTAQDDLGGMGPHPFDVEVTPDALAVDGIPTLPDPNPNRPPDPPNTPDEAHREAMRRNIEAARNAAKGRSVDSRDSAPDHHSQ